MVKFYVRNFNPRSHEGSDIPWPIFWARNTNFNPRSHEGSDMVHRKSTESARLFQSTLPRRERLIIPIFILSVNRFQSTLPRRERRWLLGWVRRYNYISIHAPTKGATVQGKILSLFCGDFNPRSHEGSDPAGVRLTVEEVKFQSTLPRRERRKRRRTICAGC